MNDTIDVCSKVKLDSAAALLSVMSVRDVMAAERWCCQLILPLFLYCDQAGTQLPYIERAAKEGYGGVWVPVYLYVCIYVLIAYASSFGHDESLTERGSESIPLVIRPSSDRSEHQSEQGTDAGRGHGVCC